MNLDTATGPVLYLSGVTVTFDGFRALNSLSLEAVLLRAFIWMPLDTAIPEELSFRGALLGGLRPLFPTRRAVALSAVVFTLWHLVIVSRTLLATNFAEQPLLLIFAGAGSGS